MVFRELLESNFRLFKSPNVINLGSCMVYQTLMTPSPPLPLKGKGDLPHNLLQ